MISSSILADLAPTGTLRIGIMYTNPVLATRDPVSGKLGGIVVDLARELASRVHLPLGLIGYETTARMLADVQAGAWDVAFSAYDPEKALASGLIYTFPYLENDGTYLVPGASPLRAIADVDRDGVRIAVSARSSIDAHLSRTLQHAKLKRIPGAIAAGELLIAGKADVLAGLRQQLLRVAAVFPGARLLEGRFMTIKSALAIPADRTAGADYLRAYVEDIKTTGLVARIVENNAVRDAAVAPGAR